jgi:muconolactone delta-isomerase
MPTTVRTRIEHKVDQPVTVELEPDPAEAVAAREGRRERRLARQG